MMNTRTVDIMNEISQYFALHPNATDTVVGISKWWVTNKKYSGTLQSVQDALDYLVDSDSVQIVRLNDGTVQYSLPKE